MFQSHPYPNPSASTQDPFASLVVLGSTHHQNEVQQSSNPFASPPKPQQAPLVSAQSVNPFDHSQTSSANPFSPRRASFRVENFAGLRGHLPGDEDSHSLYGIQSPTQHARRKSLPIQLPPQTSFGTSFGVSSSAVPPINGFGIGGPPILPNPENSRLSGFYPPSVTSTAFSASISSYDFNSQRPSAPVSVVQPSLQPQLSATGLSSVPPFDFSAQHNLAPQPVVPSSFDLLSFPESAQMESPTTLVSIPVPADPLSFANGNHITNTVQPATQTTQTVYDMLSFSDQPPASLPTTTQTNVSTVAASSNNFSTSSNSDPFAPQMPQSDPFQSSFPVAKESNSATHTTSLFAAPDTMIAFDPFGPAANFPPLPSIQESPPPLPPKPHTAPPQSNNDDDDYLDIFLNTKPSAQSQPITNPTSTTKNVAQAKLERRASLKTSAYASKPPITYTEEKEDLDEDEADDDDNDDEILSPRLKAPPGMDTDKLKKWLVSGDSYTITYEADTQLGMLLEKKDEYMPGDKRRKTERAVVKMIVSGGVSDVKGVTVGSKIVAVNQVSMLGRPYQEILNVIRASARPLQIEFERTVLEVSENDLAGYCLVQKGRSPLAPFKFANWRRMYYVLGGQIANAHVLQLYNSKQDYEDAVIALFRSEKLPVKVKTYRLTMQYKTSNFKTKAYPEENEVVKFFVVKRPSAAFKSIKIGYTEMEGIRKLHTQVCRYTTAGSSSM